jgi:hypothetical protein
MLLRPLCSSDQRSEQALRFEFRPAIRGLDVVVRCGGIISSLGSIASRGVKDALISIDTAWDRPSEPSE